MTPAVKRKTTLVPGVDAIYSASQKVVYVKKLVPHAMLPTRGSDFSAGADLYAALDNLGDEIVIYPRQRQKISTGIAVAYVEETIYGDRVDVTPIMEGYYFRVAPRSGLALKNGIAVMAGVVDLDYRGEVTAVLLNTGDIPVIIRQGDRVAQLIIEKIEAPLITETKELPSSARGEGGFGSTGR